MITNFLRPPQSLGELIADALRLIGVLSIVVAGVGWSLTDAGILAFVLPGLVVPRFVGVRAGFDVAVSVSLLVAGWSNVADLYTSVDWWDVPIHLVCTGVVSALAYLLLAGLGIVASPRAAGVRAIAPIVLTAAIGLAMSAVWEMVEWFGRTFITAQIYVTYDDTIGDMAVGGLGAILAGVLLARVRLLREPALDGGRIPASMHR
ncbi:hypothetical protein GCM10011512_06360 [Tersicoccus solisilvae]|uniref:DUF2238 domain-containing protein n=1 Tax=Tersicoccus solisilvae TaxID=1882339 RepID=A0ABQ1NQU7_9MICC|nr:hypothetical protein [Tersicoccus solisilvae]GGC82351.1 hypothetical protein GCM10011512_06360 [Tersicoccus solisilvae]